MLSLDGNNLILDIVLGVGLMLVTTGSAIAMDHFNGKKWWWKGGEGASRH